MQMNTLIANVGNKIFGRKWRIMIVFVLKDGPLRFSQIKNSLDGCSVKVLSESLQDLETHRIIVRKQYNTIPVKVTYELEKHVHPHIMVITGYLKFLNKHVYINQDLYKLPEEFYNRLEEDLKKAE